jgi:SAM-dependent methyltransferase
MLTDDRTRAAEKAKYDAQWHEPWYRQKCHGLDLYRARRDLFPQFFTTAIDFGCGTGRLVKAWLAEGVMARGFDLSAEAPDADVLPHVQIGCLWDFETLVKFEVAVCADVMEHIPPEKVRDVIRCIARACDMCVFKIANFPSVHEGRELHLTLQPRGWWAEQLSEFGEVECIEFETHTTEYVFRVTF